MKMNGNSGHPIKADEKETASDAVAIGDLDIQYNIVVMTSIITLTRMEKDLPYAQPSLFLRHSRRYRGLANSLHFMSETSCRKTSHR